MLAQEAQHRARVPERVTREEALVDHRRVLVVDNGVGDEPALPAGLRGAVVEVDVLAVHPEARIPAADLVEHGAAEQDERAEHRVGRDGLVRLLAEQVVSPLPAQRREQEPQRRAPDEGCADRREAPARRLRRAVAVEHLRPCDAATKMLLHERAQDGYGVRLRHRVGVRDQDELVLGTRCAEVRVRRERDRAGILEHPGAVRQLGRQAAGDVRDHEQLVHLRCERRQRPRELVRVAVRDDDGRHLHDSASR